MLNPTKLEKAILESSCFNSEEKELLTTRSSVICDLNDAKSKLTKFNFNLKITN